VTRLVTPALALLALVPLVPLAHEGPRGTSAPAGPGPGSQDGSGPARPGGAPFPSAGAPQLSELSSLTTDATRRAVDLGLAYLARAQARTGDGSFPVPLTEVERVDYAPLGVSALCTLAFLAAGNAPQRGPYGTEVARAVDYLLSHCDLVGESKVRGYISLQGDELSRTHGHGYATLVLAEAYGMSSGSERVREALIAAVRRIESSQGPEGGWQYSPLASAQHEGSVTICLVQALRAARDSGIQVDTQVVHRAEDYVRRLQKEDGTFSYQLGDPRSTIALTAAAISTLNATGNYDDPAIRNGVDAIWSGLARQEEDGRSPPFPYYQRLYLAQALWQLSDTSAFRRWFEGERERILRSQDDDGSWKGARFGSCYATAVNCLVLSLPDGILPIFQR